MINRRGILSAILMIFLLTGCSGGGDTPVAPDTPGDGVVPESAQGPSERVLWGVWGFQYDQASGEIIAVPKRDLAVHYDITQMVMSPTCQLCFAMTVLEYKPVEKTVRIKIGLWNRTPYTAYDVRGIFISNKESLRLVYSHGYTDYWDDGGDIALNEFVAFAYGEENHKFAPDLKSDREFLIEFETVSDLDEASLVIDASYPGNCQEPYSIGWGSQYDDLPPLGGEVTIRIGIWDWQENAGPVTVDATPLGAGIIEMEYSGGKMWAGQLATSQINTPGVHELFVKAGSAGTNHFIYEYMEVDVGQPDCLPEGNETWEDAKDLPPGEMIEDYVCEDDLWDWYKFDVEIHIADHIRLLELSGNGPATVAFFDDPTAEPLLIAEAEGGADSVVLDLTPLDLGPGTYYYRAGFAGEGPYDREYRLLNHVKDDYCYPDGNDFYTEAIEITPLNNSGSQYVCYFDQEDWFVFDYDGDPMITLDFGVVTYDESVTFTLYDEAQVLDPDGPNLLEITTELTESIGLNDLGIGPGKYYVRAFGPYGFLRQYWLGLGYDSFRWALTEWDVGHTVKMHTDSTGNIYIAGGIRYEVADLDPGPGVDLRDPPGSSDLFLIRTDPDGNYTLGVNLDGGSTKCVDLTTDSFGNIFLLGTFFTVADFDPGPGEEIRTAQGENPFLLKLDPSGNFVWVHTWVPAPFADGKYYVQTLCSDSTGAIYVGGYFKGEVDLDPGPGLDEYSPEYGGGYILRLDADGNYKWARIWPGESIDRVYDIAVSDLGEVYVVGSASPGIDFDPGPGIEMPVEYWQESVLCKYDASGAFHWVRTWGSGESHAASIVVIDDTGNVYVIGNYEGDTDFDPGPGVDEKPGSDYWGDAYLTRYSSDGDYLGAGVWGGSGNDHAEDLGLSGTGELYITGEYAGTTDFDPGEGTAFRQGGSPYILRLNTDGEYISVVTWDYFGGGRFKATNYGTNLYLAGWIHYAMDFDPGPGEFPMEFSTHFLSKFSFED